MSTRARVEQALPQDGILTLSGHGVRVAVDRGHLAVEDGVGEERRAGRFNKIDASLKRVVVIGSAGAVTLDAIHWLHDVGVPLIHLRADGTLLFVAARSGALIPALRRNQALARETGIGGRIAEDLIRRKVEGQLGLLDRLPPNRDAKPTLRRVLNRLDGAKSLEELRNLEAVAARYYWAAWRDQPVRFAGEDRKRRPTYWQRFGTRVSPLAVQGPRKAVNPANALLNYTYAILEAEARIAALAVGADPLLGLLHTDQRNRDSLACDLMEPVRPLVDTFVLDLLASREFRKEDFFEMGNGQCRLLPPITGELIQTGPRWARAVLPEAQRVAATLLEMGGTGGRTFKRARIDGLRAPNNPVGGRGVSTRPRRGHRVVMREHPQPTAIQAGEASDPRRSPEAGAKRRKAMARLARENKRWDQTNGPTDAATFTREILPQIRALPLNALMEATGLTKGACSQIRAGKTVPHPRHWRTLRELSARG